MRTRPEEPTAALAALITGNHQFLADGRGPSAWRPRVDGPEAESEAESEARTDGPPTRRGGDSGRPFALVWSREEDVELAGEVFGGGRTGVEVVASLEVVEAGMLAWGVPLIVVAARLRSRLANLEPAWEVAEARVFDAIRTLLGRGGRSGAAVVAGRTRIVGALVEDEGGRVHWLGELPEQDRIAAR
ncbi:MAG: hypothetical protein RIS86_2198 [Planctomycetota bacterium]